MMRAVAVAVQGTSRIANRAVFGAAELVWRGANGAVLARRALPTHAAGVSPCREDEERDLGHGQTICP